MGSHRCVGASPVPCELRLQFRSVVLVSKGPCPRFAAGRTNPFPSVRDRALPFVLPFGDASGLTPESLNSLKAAGPPFARGRAGLPSGREMSELVCWWGFSRRGLAGGVSCCHHGGHIPHTPPKFKIFLRFIFF